MLRRPQLLASQPSQPPERKEMVLINKVVKNKTDKLAVKSIFWVYKMLNQDLNLTLAKKYSSNPLVN